MLNQVILVGIVNSIDRLAEIVSIDIRRANEKDSDIIPVTLNEGLIDSVLEHLAKGSTIGVKASLSIDNNILRIIGERITFINSKNE